MKSLFIDNHAVEEIDNLARKLHPLQKFEKNVVLRAEHRWENCGIMMWTTPHGFPMKRFTNALLRQFRVRQPGGQA